VLASIYSATGEGEGRVGKRVKINAQSTFTEQQLYINF
jgi:hypothetical protein